MTKKRNNKTSGRYSTLILNNPIDDVVKFQECMIKSLLETSEEWDNNNDFQEIVRFQEDILAVLKLVRCKSDDISNEIVEYTPLGLRTDDIN